MNRFARLLAAGLLLWTAARSHAQTFPTGIHDPQVIKAGDWYYLFCTGPGLPTWRSRDAADWQRTGSVFDTQPAWSAADFKINNYLWAPEVAFFGGRFHLYYAASHFGRSDSAIGHATADTLDRDAKNYGWRDDGPIVRTHDGSGWNAIDPAVFVEDDGTPWLIAGSFWSGLKLMRLDPHTGRRADDAMVDVARRPGSGAIEAGSVFKRDGYYYLIASYDYCCRGALSTYNLRIGRSKALAGPYADMQGRPMLDGGGTPLLAGYGDVRGPGHSSVFSDKGQVYVVHHFYDAAHGGRPTPQVRPLLWPGGGWPVAGEPVTARPPATRPTTRPTPPAGTWAVSLDYDEPFDADFLPDGTTRPNVGRWTADERGVTLSVGRNNPAKFRLLYDPTGTVLTGRISDGVILRAVKR